MTRIGSNPSLPALQSPSLSEQTSPPAAEPQREAPAGQSRFTDDKPLNLQALTGQRSGGGALISRSLWLGTDVTPSTPAARASQLHQAFQAGDSSRALSLLRGGTAESNATLMAAYVQRYGNDLEYDMRGLSLNPSGPLDFHGFSLTMRGLKGADLQEGLRLLHGPRLEKNAARIAELVAQRPESTPEGRREIYDMLARAGGEERTLLASLYRQQTGGDLVEALRPVFAAASKSSPPLTSDPSKTVAIVVSSGNWKKVLDGQVEQHVGGYHWREVEAYVKEALDHGYTPVIFTEDGLPPSPDALSLLENTFGYKMGFGTSAQNGVGSAQGKAILEGFAAPRSLADFDPSQFAALHVAGGHGSNQDLVGSARVESAALRMHEQGKMVTAVCHATPSLGRLLQGRPATGFSPQLDAITAKNGFVLPEFIPPYDAHQGLRDIGAIVSPWGVAQAFANLNFTEVSNTDGTPVITGTGPEATDDVARMAFEWLER